MGNSPLASIIVNNYNYGRFLRDAIDSALNQTYPRAEVIVVDDGSADDSRQIIAEYADRIVPVLKENGGQASARNAGFEASKGEVIIFLDSDDMLVPTALELAVPHFEDPQVSKVHWPLREVDKHGTHTGRVTPKGELKEGDLKAQMTQNGYAGANASPGGLSGSAYACRFLKKVCPIRDCGDGYGADGYLEILAPIYGHLRRIDEPQGLRRVHGENVSGGQSIETKIRRDLRRHQYHTDALSDHLRSMGIKVDPESWEGPGSYHAWLTSTLGFLEQTASLVPEGRTLALVDDGHLGTDCISGRRILPFPERNGKFGGRPATDEMAVDQLQRIRSCGAEFMVFAPWTYWWLECYPEFHNVLRSKFKCLIHTDSLIVFDMRDSAIETH